MTTTRALSGNAGVSEVGNDRPLSNGPPKGKEDGAAFVGWYEQNLARLEELSPADIAGRYANNAADPFAYYRATPWSFHNDLERGFKELATLKPGAPRIQIAGDPHLFNFGTMWSGEKPVWGLNDFDQARRGSPEADLERLAASVVVMANKLGLSEAQKRELVDEVSHSWRKEVGDQASSKDGKSNGGFIGSGHADGPVKDLLDDIDKKELTHGGKGYDRSGAQRHLLDKLGVKNGVFTPTRQDKAGGPSDMAPVTKEERAALTASLKAYAARLPPGSEIDRKALVADGANILDLGRKLGSGGSSHGLDRFEVLVANKDPKQPPIVLEIKKCPSIDGEKPVDGPGIVSAYNGLGGGTNPLTGYSRFDGEDVLVREIEPEKGALKPEDIKSFEQLKKVSGDAAVALARAHTAVKGNAELLDKWAGDKKSDWDGATTRLEEFALRYAEKNQKDFDNYRQNPPPGVPVAAGPRAGAQPTRGWGAAAPELAANRGGWRPGGGSAA